MLVLSRRINESIVIGGTIRITMTSVTPRRVRLAIDAPPGVPILRAELLPASPHLGAGPSQPPAPGGPDDRDRARPPARVHTDG